MKTYEGMFLLDSGQANFEEAVAPIRNVLDRSGAEILNIKKWDERRLAYEIKGRRRGLYVLSYFKALPEKITEIEHDVKLNERILRALILSAEEVTEEKMAAPTPAELEPARREYDAEPRRTPDEAAEIEVETVAADEAVELDEIDETEEA